MTDYRSAKPGMFAPATGTRPFTSRSHPSPAVSASNAGLLEGSIESFNQGLMLGGEQSLHPSAGYRRTMPMTTDLARGDIDETQLRISQVFWPANYKAPTLPLLVNSIRTDNIGDGGLIIKKTRVIQGMAHYNVDIRQALTRGGMTQEERAVQREQFGTEVRAMYTPYLYSTRTDLANPQFVEEMMKIWADAHDRVLTAVELYVRRTMLNEMPCVFHLSPNPGDQERYRRQTFAICNRQPQEFVNSLRGVINEGIIEAQFTVSSDTMGKLLLVPRNAFTAYYGRAPNQAMSRDEQDATVQYTMYTSYKLTPDRIATTATTATVPIEVDGISIVPYDIIPEGRVDIPDSFSRLVVMQSSIIIPRGTKSVCIRTPQGLRTLHAPDLAISSEMYWENDQVKLDGSFKSQEDTDCFQPNGTASNATIGGSWAMQSKECADELAKWLIAIVDALGGLEEAVPRLRLHLSNEYRAAEQRMNASRQPSGEHGEEEANYANFEPYEHLMTVLSYDPRSGEDSADQDIAELIMTMAMLPGTRRVLTYLHSVVPFTFCNFSFFIAGSMRTFDAYLIHPKSVLLVQADNLFERFSNPGMVGPDWYRINSSLVAAHVESRPNIRVPDAYIDNIHFNLRHIGTAREMDRTNCQRGRLFSDNRELTSFAVFSGVTNQLADWCQNGPDSVVKLPTRDQVNGLFGQNTIQAKVTQNLLSPGQWMQVSAEDDMRVGGENEASFTFWEPFPAELNMIDMDKPRVLEGFGQLNFPKA